MTPEERADWVTGETIRKYTDGGYDVVVPAYRAVLIDAIRTAEAEAYRRGQNEMRSRAIRIAMEEKKTSDGIGITCERMELLQIHDESMPTPTAPQSANETKEEEK